MRKMFYTLFVSLTLFIPIGAKLCESAKNTFNFNNKVNVFPTIELGPLSNKQAILNDPLLPEIVQHVRAKYGVHTVILHGSRARGTATVKSDYDLIGLQKSGEKKNYQEFFKGAYLDVSIYPQNFKIEDATNFSLLTFWQEAVILYKQNHEGERFINAVKEAFYNREDLSEAKKSKIRLLTMNFNRSQENEIREYFYRHKFLTLALTEYFPIRNLVYKGPRKSFEWLKKYDPLTYTAFNRALAPKACHESLHGLLTRVAGPDLDTNVQDQNSALKKPQKKEKYVFSKDSLLPDIVQHIQKTYGVHTLILFGSRAQGTASSKSDYDFIAFRGGGTPSESVRDLFKGFYLDLHILSEDVLNDMNAIGFLSLVQETAVLLQKNQLGDRFIEAIKGTYDQGFFTSDQIKQKVVDEIKMNFWKMDNTLEGSFYVHSLLSSILEHYFTLRNLYYIGSRESFQWIKKNDLLTYNAFEKALKPGATREALKQLVDRVIAPFEQKKKVNVTTHPRDAVKQPGAKKTA